MKVTLALLTDILSFGVRITRIVTDAGVVCSHILSRLVLSGHERGEGQRAKMRRF